MSQRTTRRNFLQTSAAAGVGFWVAGGIAPKPSLAAIEEIRFACIGIGGKGSSDSGDAKGHGKVVAICDIDDERLGGAADKFPGAKSYNDFRKLLEENEKNIDAVTVSTPDHTHAPASVMAMRMGKGCFCQKPMTHSIYEARLMGQIAAEKKLATQMGNQGTADSTLRQSAAIIRAGKIGRVKEVHVWTNRPVWPQGGGMPPEEPVPSHVHWAEWIGPAKMRPYSAAYHPFKWRGFWDFGTGALGDMACHTLNMAYMALDLRDPISVQATTSGHNKITYPKFSEIRYEFPQLGDRPALTMYWYDGGKKVDKKLLGGRPMTDSGALVVGDMGSLYSTGDYGGDGNGTGILAGGDWTPQKEIKDIEFERSPGHFTEYANAVKGEGEARSNFPNYATGLTETVLLGNLAVWAASEPGEGPKVEWDAKNLKPSGAANLEEIVKPTYHNGYSLDMS